MKYTKSEAHMVADFLIAVYSKELIYYCALTF